MLTKQYTVTPQNVEKLKKILENLQDAYGYNTYDVRQLRYWIEDLEREAM